MKISKHTTNYEYIHGDFDRDGTPNIDDTYPFDPSRSEPVNKEISLSKTFKYVDEQRSKAIPLAERLKKRYGATDARVKDTYSIINKQVRRNKNISNDFIGLRFITTTKKEAKKRWMKFNKTNQLSNVKMGVKSKYGELIGSENIYRRKTPYKAFHSNLIIGTKKKGYGFEAQFVPRKQAEKNSELHKIYKSSFK